MSAASSARGRIEMRKMIVIGTLVGMLLAMFALAPSVGRADDVMVHVSHNKLDPAEVEVSVGTTVVFHNMVSMPGGHTIVASDDSASSPPLGKDEKWSHTFAKAGVYTFAIKEHPSATCKVVVE